MFYQWLAVLHQREARPTGRHRSPLPRWGFWEPGEDLEHLGGNKVYVIRRQKQIFVLINFFHIKYLELCAHIKGFKSLYMFPESYRQLSHWYLRCPPRQGCEPRLSRFPHPAVRPLRLWRHSGLWWFPHGPCCLPPWQPAAREPEPSSRSAFTKEAESQPGRRNSLQLSI